MSLLALLVATTLLDFDDAADATLWRPVDDVVMGGVSRSAFGIAEPGIARFSGNVSLENFGGFASVRTPPRDWDTASATAFVLRVRGDGKQYKFTLRTGDGRQTPIASTSAGASSATSRSVPPGSPMNS